MLRTTGTFSSRFPRALDVSLSFFGHVLAHEMLPAISSREPWWSEPGVGCHMGPVPSLDPENTRRSVCLPALEPRVHPLRPIRAETPQPLPTGSQPPPLHTGLCHLPPSPRSPPSQCSREPLPKAAPPLVSPAYFRVSQQRSGQARGREGLWTLSGGPGSGLAGLGVVMAGMGGAGVSRGSGDGGPRGLRGSGHLPEVRGVLPEFLSQLSPRPLEGAAGCELLC